MNRIALFSLLLSAAACGPYEPAKSDATTTTTPTTTSPDTIEPDTITPVEGTTLADGLVAPPSGTAAGWVALNRFGQADVGSDGRFALPVADDGVTLTIAFDPAHPEAPLLTLTVRVIELDTTPPALLVDARTTAEAIVLMHPRVVPHEAWRLRALGTMARDSAPIDDLAQLIGDAFSNWQVSARGFYADAVTAVLRRAAPPWSTSLAVDLPLDPDGARVVRGAGQPVVDVHIKDGAVTFEALPGSPPRFDVTVTPLDAGASSLADVLALRAAPELPGALETIDGTPLPLDEGLYRVSVTADAGANATLADARARAVWAPSSGDMANEAGSAIVAVLEPLAALGVDSQLVADPNHPQAALLDARRGATSETFTLVVGDPFAARFDETELKDDGRVRVAGRHLGRLAFVDARGRARAPALDVTADDGRYLSLPEGLFGEVHLRAETPSGLFASEVITTLEAPAAVPPQPLAPTIVDGPTVLPRGESARFTVSHAHGVSVSAGDLEVPVLIVADDLVVLDTRGLAAGEHTLTFTTDAGSADAPLALVEVTPTYERTITFHALDPIDRPGLYATARDLANGTRVAAGEFWRRETNAIVDGSWYCPVDIRPDTAIVTPPPTCTHSSLICDDLWLWDDTRDASEWLTVTRPPGRASSGPHCPAIPGPISWDTVARSDLRDTITSTDILQVAGEVSGKNVVVALPNARGGGLRIVPPADGGRSEITLDVYVLDAIGSDTTPVVTLDGVRGVTITRLEVIGRSNAGGAGCGVGVRITNSHDVRVDRLLVDQCDRAIEVVGSTDVRLGSLEVPVVINRAKTTGLLVDDSEDVYVQAEVGFVRLNGTLLSQGVDAIGDGVVLRQSERVTLAGIVTSTRGAAVHIDGGAHVHVGPMALGFVPNGATPFLTGSRIGQGVTLGGYPDAVRLTDLTIDQVASDALALGGGTRTRIEDVTLGPSFGVFMGARFVADNYPHDVDVARLNVAWATFDAVRVEASGRSAFTDLTVGHAGVCAFAVDAGRNVSVTGAELAAPICGYSATDVALSDVAATELRLELCDSFRVEDSVVGPVELATSRGVILTDTTLGPVTITGPNSAHGDPISIIDPRAPIASVTVTDSRVPVQLFGITADVVDLASRATVILRDAELGATYVRGVGSVHVDGSVASDTLTVTSGRLVSDASGLAVTVSEAGELVARGPIGLGPIVTRGLVALVDAEATLDIDGCTPEAAVIVSGGTLAGLDVAACGGRVFVTRTTIDAVALEGTRGATLTDVKATSVALTESSDARLVRIEANGVERGGTTRGRVIGTLGLAPVDGDPSGHGVAIGDTVHITAAPAHALVELLGKRGQVLARTFASDGEALFRGVANTTGLLVQATLLDGTSGPPIALQAAGTPACVATSAPSEVRDAVLAPTDCLGQACAFELRVATEPRSDVVLVERGSGAETRLTDDDAEERDPVFASDGTVWFARRELGGDWTLAQVDVDSAVMTVVLALPGDVLWPAPSPDGSAIAFASCPLGEAETCHLAVLDRPSGAVGIPAEGGWPAARACDERRPTWLASDAASASGAALMVERRDVGDRDGAASQDVMSALGLVRWRL